MSAGYKQFCPIAKGAEIVATRWTPLVLRELMYGERGFNDIHHGVPSMSRALLVERLRQLETDGVVERVERKDGAGADYRLTRAGEALRPILDLLGRWGLEYGRGRLDPSDRDADVLMWWLRRRVDIGTLPPKRVVVRFELSGVARCRTGVRLHWLVLKRDGVDVCWKDPGYDIDIRIAGNIAALIDVYLGFSTWSKATRGGIRVDGDRALVGNLERWLRLDLAVGRELPVIPAAPKKRRPPRKVGEQTAAAVR